MDQNPEGKNTEHSQEHSENMFNEVLVYRQDVVRCSKFESLLGIAMEVAGDSDSEGSITDVDDGDDDDEGTDGEEEEDVENKNEVSGNGDNNDASGVDGSHNDDSLSDGQVRITWMDGSETTENNYELTVVDRNFLHGDIVASASNPTGQLGLVINVNIKVDILSATGELIKDIPSKDLKRIRKFSVGDFVIHGSWLGRVDEVLDNVTVMFDDGFVCKVVKADPLRLKPVSKPIVDDADCPYYPGQRVKAVSSSVFKASRWPALFKANRLEGTVIKVTTASVIVYWIASAYLGVGTDSATVPPEEQNPKNLTLLSCFSHANWQLADWCLFPLSQQLTTSMNTNLSESVGGCDSCIDHTDDADVSGSAPDVPELDVSNNNLSIESGHLINSNDPYIQTNPENMLDGHITSTDANFDGYSQPQSNHSMNVESEADQTHGTESNDLAGYCSCSSSSSVSKEPAHESWPTYRKKLRKVLFKREKKCRRKDETYERALLIVNTATNIDVVWQDGTIELGLSSTSVIPIHTPNDNEFFPEQYVVEKASNEGESSETSRVGVVRSMNAQDRTVRVRWLKPVSRPEEPREFGFEEIVSSYELDVHPDYDYCYGDVVVRLPPVSGDLAGPGRSVLEQEKPTCLSDMDNGSCRQDLDENREQQQVLNDEACDNNVCIPWVGNITGFQDGDIEVTWIDGMVSKVGPQEIYVVGRDDDGDSFDGGSGDGASWETVDEDEMDTLDIGEKEVDSQNPGDTTESTIILQEDSNSERNGPLAVPLAAIDYVTKFATGLFSRAKKQLNSSASDQIESSSETEYRAGNEVPEETLDDEDNDEESDVSNDVKMENICVMEEGQSPVTSSGSGEEKLDGVIDKGISMGGDDGHKEAHNTDDLCKFKHFDITENPSDHHFLSHDDTTTCGKKWVKKVQQEWNILEKNLPDAIYVRVFEDRMDLLRAVIIGACGTPYQDGLFFFDFHLPSEYPKVPPSAYYHSGGLRVNPNLYVDGKVCLSLLNTWTGKGNEIWDASSSSILQVLVSLQGLVLNSKPYFNEAGYEKQVGTLEGEKNSVPYNENTYLLNLKSMLYLLRRPPMHFEDFVKDHFRIRGHYILKACEAYMAGYLIGSLTVDASLTEKSKEHSCSVGFKLTLAKILPKLITALKEVGVDCLQFEHLLKSENFPES